MSGKKVLTLVALTVATATASVLVGPGRWTTATMLKVEAAAGMASISGTVEAPKPFKAAQVYIRNTDKRILYMVYTQAGHFRAVQLFPGHYEVTVVEKGFTSDKQSLDIKAGDAPTVKMTLKEVATESQVVTDTNQNLEGEVANRVRVSFDLYDNVYPPGPGRDIAEHTCMVCHGENFISSQPAREEVWNARVDKMMGKENWNRAAQSYAEGILSYRAQWLKFNVDDRKTLLAYLVKNFGPGAKARNVKTVKETPLDEAKLAKAMYESYIKEDAPNEGVHSSEYADAFGYQGRRVIQDVRFDAEGNVWASDRGAPRRLVKLDPRTGTMKEWLTPHPKTDIHEVLIWKDGLIYMPEHAEGGIRSYLLVFDPKQEKWIKSVDEDPTDIVRNGIKWTQSQAFDSKGNLYVIWIMGGALTRYDHETGKVEVFPMPSTNAIPRHRRRQERQHLDRGVGRREDREIRHEGEDVDGIRAAELSQPDAPRERGLLQQHLVGRVGGRPAAPGQTGEARSGDRQDHRVHDSGAGRESVRRVAGSPGQHLVPGFADTGSHRHDRHIQPEGSDLGVLSQAAVLGGHAEDSAHQGRRDLVRTARQPRGTGDRRALSGHGQDHELRRLLRERPRDIRSRRVRRPSGRRRRAATKAAPAAKNRGEACDEGRRRAKGQ